LTVMSFGTGYRPQFVTIPEIADPPGSDSLFWLKWLMSESSSDASDMQSYMLRTRDMFPRLDFRRFQISLDPVAMHKLPDVSLNDVHETNAASLHELTESELAGIE